MRRCARLIAWLLLVSALIGAYGALTAVLILALTGEVALVVLILRDIKAPPPDEATGTWQLPPG